MVEAGELAYVENASGTAALLEQFLLLFRYLSKPVDWVTLRDEMQAVFSYAFLKQSKYGTVIRVCDYSILDLFVKRGDILYFLDACLAKKQLLNAAYELKLKLTVDVAKGQKLKVRVVSLNESSDYFEKDVEL